ncbi:MAG: hypothetical protein NC483_03955 [Ruminococcus sp.]|nr:hypothetical protein [Ruminococcus sp.]
MKRNLIINTYQKNVLLFKEQTTGYIEDNILEYHTDNEKIRINLSTYSFIKENEESVLRIVKDKCELRIKALNQSLDIPILYFNYGRDNNIIVLEYKLESQELPLKIVIEIGDEIDEI